MTWAELRQTSEESLRAAGFDNAARLVYDWFDDVFGWAARKSGEVVPHLSIQTATEQLERLLAGEPLAYVTGLAHFYGLELEVGPGVLIPRPETEELVRWILESHGHERQLRFADICTGSGCIALAIARRQLLWSGYALDVSTHAVEIALRNVARLDLEEQLAVIQDDLFDLQRLPAELDLIVSNPPYIPLSDWSRVDRQVADWEPRIALQVGDEDPLLFYRELCACAKNHLRDGGWLYVECNDLYANEVVELFTTQNLTQVECFTDMQGKPRHVRGQLPVIQ